MICKYCKCRYFIGADDNRYFPCEAAAEHLWVIDVDDAVDAAWERNELLTKRKLND